MAGGMCGGACAWQGSMCGRSGACMAGVAGGVHGRGHVWQRGAYMAGCVCGGGCMAGGVHGRGHVWQREACMAGGVHGRGHVWQRGACMAEGACMAGGCMACMPSPL